ncbi:MAG: hypothetical protein JWO52_4052 [Gammaproteobacteria bacterium]|nr:hypothetical protein [Gammaproteobacteria bacterium]
MTDPVVPVVPPVVVPVAPVVPPVVVPEPKEPQTFSLEYVKELRAESKGYRLKLSESEQQKADALKQVETATAAADTKVKDANTAAEQRIIRAELKAEALKAGMVDLDGLKLADLTKVKINDKGEIEGAEALMTELKKAKPYLFGTVSTSSTAPVPPVDKTAPKLVKDMTPEERAKARAALGRGSR